MRYLDTSFVAPYFLAEPSSLSVQRYFSATAPGVLAISDWTRVEFSSLLSMRCRMGLLTPETLHDAETQFETIVENVFTIFLPDRNDYRAATRYLRHYETGLRGGDALHLAIATNRDAETIHSFDKAMLRAGTTLGLPVSDRTR